MLGQSTYCVTMYFQISVADGGAILDPGEGSSGTASTAAMAPVAPISSATATCSGSDSVAPAAATYSSRSSSENLVTARRGKNAVAEESDDDDDDFSVPDPESPAKAGKPSSVFRAQQTVSRSATAASAKSLDRMLDNLGTRKGLFNCQNYQKIFVV